MKETKTRRSELSRKTKESDIQVRLDLDGSGEIEVRTGIAFLDHMISSLAFHAGFDLTLCAVGDLEVDDHHTAEDSAVALGEAFAVCVGDRRGLARFGSAYAPLDEALMRAVVDLSGRPYAVIEWNLSRESIGGLATENAAHWFRSFANAGGLTLHVDLLRGENDHHKIEAAFKATALALRQAVVRTGISQIPSTKGVL